jgi:MoxR-like ATPase
MTTQPEDPHFENEENLPIHEGDDFQSRLPLKALKDAVDQIKSELNTVIIGQEAFIEQLIVALLANGHVLIEGVPGIAKTVTAKLFARTLDTGYSRIQFTPDLMPSDVLGTSILNRQSSQFEFRPGPVFSNIVLIDEINRAPAKTQSALFEVMEERQITLDGKRMPMDFPFMVLATQNPIEQEGTYALPEAQLDRFLFKINVTYPSLEEEVLILKSHHHRKGEDPLPKIKQILNPESLATYRRLTAEVLLEEKILRYIAELVLKTRNHPHLFLGGSPRASLAIMHASQAFAAISGRDFVTPDDVKRSALPVLCHRLMLTPEREMEGMTPESVIDTVIQTTPVPR